MNSRGAIWIHAVSLGEVNAARGIVRGLEERAPDRPVMISTTTDTGFARAVSLFGADRVFRYPLDFSWTVKTALHRINPILIVLVELEVWHNLVTIAARRGISVCVINGRLTERSCRRFGWIAPLARRMFARLTWVGAQDEATADRFARVGVPRDRITVTGSVKWDTAEIAERIAGQDELASALGISPHAPLWVCGSTGPGEEAILLDMYTRLRADHPDLQFALVPRKPERFDEVAELIRRRGFDCVRRTRHNDANPNTVPQSDAPRVILGDTLGELRKFYALATAVFVGRSLVPMGGSDPMEVAALGKPIFTGPHMDNFAEPVRVLAACGALHHADQVDDLTRRLSAWLADPSTARRLGDAGREAVRANQGATSRTLDRLASLLAD